MARRDDEIKRLIHYAKGMGVKVVLRSKGEGDDSAYWSIDGSMIEVFTTPTKSKTSIVLDLLHELGHQVWFVHEKDRQPDLKFEEALGRPEDDISKELRKKIYDVEVAGTTWWESIYKDTNLKVPKWKVNSAMEFDMWMYEQYYETGVFPKGKARTAKLREVRAKWRPKR
jgi:hypothetical protein